MKRLVVVALLALFVVFATAPVADATGDCKSYSRVKECLKRYFRFRECNWVKETCDASITLPAGEVKVCVTRGEWLGPYLHHQITGAGDLDALYEAWCVDVPGAIGVGCYQATLVSSLETMGQSVIRAPENWDLINYVLNNVPEYRATYGANQIDIQYVFWTLADPGATPGEVPYDMSVANAILADARANGEGFEPGTGELAAVVIVHAQPEIQETIIGVAVSKCVKKTTCRKYKKYKKYRKYTWCKKTRKYKKCWSWKRRCGRD